MLIWGSRGGPSTVDKLAAELLEAVLEELEHLVQPDGAAGEF